MIKMISAMDEKRAIGKDGKIPWHIEEDLERFRKLITGQIIVMGRGTFESLKEHYPNDNGHPLASRNIVLSKTLEISGVEIYRNPKDIVTAVSGQSMWIIGGGEIYKSFLPFTDELDLTKISGDYNGDRFFPEYEYLFDKVSEEKGKEEGVVFERWVRKGIIKGVF